MKDESELVSSFGGENETCEAKLTEKTTCASIQPTVNSVVKVATAVRPLEKQKKSSHNEAAATIYTGGRQSVARGPLPGPQHITYVRPAGPFSFPQLV